MAPDSDTSRYGINALRTRRCECGAADCTAVVEISWAEEDAVDHYHDDQWINGSYRRRYNDPLPAAVRVFAM